MPTRGQPGPVRVHEVAVEGEQSRAELAGEARAAWPEEPAPQRHRLLHGKGCDAAGLPQSHHLAQAGFGLREPVGERSAEALVLRHSIAEPDTEVEATVAEDVDHRGFLGELRRLAQRGEQHGGADADGARACRDRGREGERLREIAVLEEVVLGEPHRRRAEALGTLDELERARVVVGPRPRPLGRVATVEVDADVHRQSRGANNTTVCSSSTASKRARTLLADVHRLRIAVDDVRHESHPFVEVDEREHVRHARRERRDRRPADHRERVDRSFAAATRRTRAPRADSSCTTGAGSAGTARTRGSAGSPDGRRAPRPRTAPRGP